MKISVTEHSSVHLRFVWQTSHYQKVLTQNGLMRSIHGKCIFFSQKITLACLLPNAKITFTFSKNTLAYANVIPTGHSIQWIQLNSFQSNVLCWFYYYLNNICVLNLLAWFDSLIYFCILRCSFNEIRILGLIIYIE